MSAEEPLTDGQRFPLQNEAGTRMLRRLLEHPAGPTFHNRAGDRLTESGLASVRRYAEHVRTARSTWKHGELPPWVRELMTFCRNEVPFYRRRLDWSDDFFNLPPLIREDIHGQPWAFVPDSADLSDLIVYTTAGTMGDRLTIPSRPEIAARYLPLMEVALAVQGVRLEGGSRVSIVQVHAQARTYTFASVISYLDFAGYVKVNLNPADWRNPDDRTKFLDDCNPELYTGDPLAFTELMKLPLRTRPRALLSSAATLLPGLRHELESHFRCPVIDVYSLNEAGPVAFATVGGFEVLPPELYVEILGPNDQPCPPGTQGEIVLSGGHNPYLSLLRYRTGDHAAMDFTGTMPVLRGFEGRSPVVFRDFTGRKFNNIDVTFALRDLPLSCFALHQASDGSLRFRARCDPATLEAAAPALRRLFGALPLDLQLISEAEAWTGKVIQYTSDLAESF